MAYVWESLSTAMFCHSLIKNKIDLTVFLASVNSKEIGEDIDKDQVIDFVLSVLKSRKK